MEPIGEPHALLRRLARRCGLGYHCVPGRFCPVFALLKCRQGQRSGSAHTFGCRKVGRLGLIRSNLVRCASLSLQRLQLGSDYVFPIALWTIAVLGHIAMKISQNSAAMTFFAIWNFLSIFRRIASLVAVASLAGCVTLPSSGPTGREIEKSTRVGVDGVAIRIVDVESSGALPVRTAHGPEVFADRLPPPTDMVGPGDVLDITVYESGVTLFGGSGRTLPEGVGFDPSAKAEHLPATRVDDAGEIRLPFAGRLRVAGRTVEEVGRQIRAALHGYSQNPQVLVSLREVITNSVIVSGEVNRPGRLVLPTNRETIVDAIALAGGYRGEAKDLSIRLDRQERTEQFRLADAMDGTAHVLRVYPGDRISVLRAPQSFSVMGAPGRVELFTFARPNQSLAEAVAQAGGTNPTFGDPKAIFVFRNMVVDGGRLEPVVYHFNMMKAGSYFLAQGFTMDDKDVVYVGNARANQPTKLIQLISLLFTPIVTVTSAAQVLKN